MAGPFEPLPGGGGISGEDGAQCLPGAAPGDSGCCEGKARATDPERARAARGGPAGDPARAPAVRLWDGLISQADKEGAGSSPASAAALAEAFDVLRFLAMPLPDEILTEAAVLFHDVRAEDIDPEAHAGFVIARVLDHGTLASVRALLRHYGRERIRGFFRQGGSERISRRTVPLWAAFLGLAPDECSPRSSLRRSSPFWTA
jgi:hypothetical protein